MEVTQSTLDSLNVEQSVKDNKANLEALGGVDGFVNMLGTNISTGLTTEQVNASRTKFGNNQFPEAPMEGYLSLLLGAFADPTLIVLLCAAAVSLIIGVINSPSDGWIEGAAIFIAVFAVANITAGNDYTKELQFRALESSSQDDERTSVMRNGVIERINPRDLVVGDVIILQVCWNALLFIAFTDLNGAGWGPNSCRQHSGGQSHRKVQRIFTDRRSR